MISPKTDPTLVGSLLRPSWRLRILQSRLERRHVVEQSPGQQEWATEYSRSKPRQIYKKLTCYFLKNLLSIAYLVKMRAAYSISSFERENRLMRCLRHWNKTVQIRYRSNL